MSLLDGVAMALARTGLPRLLPARGPLVLMYHGLGGEDGVAPAEFEAQLDLLSARRRIVPLAEAVAALGSPAAAGLASLTFDDGYRDFASEAVPRLRARGLHATLFVPSGFIGGHNAWDEGRAPRRPILDAAGLRDLDPRVAEIGAHGASHVRMRGLDAAALRQETREARRALEAASEREIRFFAYPYGQLDDFDAAAEAAVASAGFLAACSTHFGRSSRPSERFRLRRVGVEPHDSLAGVAAKLDGAYDWVRWKERGGVLLRGLRGGA